MYEVHVDLFTDHKSIQYLFTGRELSLHQWRCLGLLKNYDMNVHYHPGKANVVADVLSGIIMGRKAHVKDENKELVKDVHILARLGVRLVDSASRGVSVHPSSESSLLVEVKVGMYFHHMLMELKDSMLVKMNESFDQGDNDILRYEDRLCLLDMDDLRTRIIVETHDSRYYIHPYFTKMFHELK